MTFAIKTLAAGFSGCDRKKKIAIRTTQETRNKKQIRKIYMTSIPPCIHIKQYKKQETRNKKQETRDGTHCMGRFGTSRGLIKEVFRKGEAKPEYDLKTHKERNIITSTTFG